MNSRSDGIALTNPDTNDIFVIRRNSSRGNNVVFPTATINSPPSRGSQILAESFTEGHRGSHVLNYYDTVRNWFMKKCHGVVPAQPPSSDQTVEEVDANPDIFVVHTNSSQEHVCRDDTSSGEPPSPITGSNGLLVDEKDGGCREGALASSRRIKDWFRGKCQCITRNSSVNDCVIELAQMDTGNIFEVRRNSSNNRENRLLSPDHVAEMGLPFQVEVSNNSPFQVMAACCRNLNDWVCAKYLGVSTQLGSTFDWSVLQAWNILAYVTCSVPYRLELDNEGKYCVKSHIVQKIAWIIQMGFVIAGVFRRFALLIPNAHLDQPDPFEYIKVANAVAQGLLILVFMKVITFDSTLLMQIHQNFKDNNNNNLPQSHSRKMGLFAFASFGCFVLIMLAIDTITSVWDFYGSSSFSPTILLQTFACYSRLTYFWQKVDECEEEGFIYLSDVPSFEILLGLLGILTFISENLFRHNLTLAIGACSITLVIPAWVATGDDDEASTEVGVYQLTAKHNLLANLSDDISRYIGSTLMLQMASVAFTLSIVLKIVFVDSSPHFIPLFLSMLASLLSFLIASACAMLIEEIEDRFTNPNNLHQLPTNALAAAAFLLRFFKKSVGIGYRGIFVLNFRFLVGYLGIIGTLTKVLYETAKDTALGEQ